MRKLMLLAAMVAMVLAITIPAMAANEAGDQFATGCVAGQNVEQNVEAVAVGGAGGDASATIGEADQIAVPVAIDFLDLAFLGDAGDAIAVANQYIAAVGGDASGGDAVNVVTLDASQTQNCDSTISQAQYVGDVK